MYNIKKIWEPTWFQGNNKTDKYFEGWYFKNVSENRMHCWSFIPGISLSGENSHSFVQAINGTTGETYYFRYRTDEFSYSKIGFHVRIAKNFFYEDSFEIDLENENLRIKGNITIEGNAKYKASYLRPGIMGWYRYVPFMECYHAVVSLDHSIFGSLEINGKSISFNMGRGYIEKDWGSSMPKAWIWMQCNHFSDIGTSFMLSVARIPWIGKTFTGFLGFFHHKGITQTFATYTGAKLSAVSYTENKVNIEIKAGKYFIKIEGTNNSYGALKAPVFGQMDRVIHESIDAKLKIEVLDKKRNIIYSGHGVNAGLEMVGDLELLK